MTNSIEEVANQAFDYVIVGGGTAGLTLAARLTEDPTNKVLVLEAGPENLNDPAILTPAPPGLTMNNPKYAWPFKTVPQPGLGGREMPMQRGRMLGGSSGLNFLLWNKPPAGDIDDWEKLGNPGWNWERFQKYAKKMEGFHPSGPEAQELHRQKTIISSHGLDGPVKTMFPKWVCDVQNPIEDSIRAAGIPLAKDPFGGDPVGTYMGTGSVDHRTAARSYSVPAYYVPNKGRSNLTVLCGAIVHRILFASFVGGGEIEASGVEFEHGDVKHVVDARKEVILCAGALKTPQILELSGIGDKKVLEPLGIETKLYLPGVGANMQEHLFCVAIFELGPNVEFGTFDDLHNKDFAAKELKEYAHHQGIHTTFLTGLTFVPPQFITRTQSEAVELIASQKAKVEAAIAAGTLPPGLKEQWMLQIERYEQAKSGSCEVITFPGFFGGVGEPGKKYVTIAGNLNSMFSRGSVHITSHNLMDDPAMDPRYFEEHFDLKLFAELMRFVRRIPDHEPLKGLIAKEVFPGPSVSTDEQIQEFIKKHSNTTWHTISTAAMLPRDQNGVVDGNLRVYGTKNVRVADLSVVPLHVAAHTQREAAADIVMGKA
ncbi:GMC oxidoreductase [Rickenella mellea]|uniref:GMC oxidoreductase n=1 Tax=Rickenella mellea TaxID=50990 RepID=A0A4Y7Q3A7_9AGAM|nr:GMC oxidoreductase [Rickenella mellea]